jgi:hypothetical protein
VVGRCSGEIPYKRGTSLNGLYSLKWGPISLLEMSLSFDGNVGKVKVEKGG